MKVAVFGRYYNDTTSASVETLFTYLSKKGVETYIENQFHKLIEDEDHGIKNFENYKKFTELNKTFDFLVSIGGDGTILRATIFVKDLGIPIIGINTGRLGFLATIHVDAIEQAVQNILDGYYKISERTLLTVKSMAFALNEITVSRKNSTAMITVDTYLDNEFLNSYWSDGLIVSTPTGSTGYSLSCGGPVITPGAKKTLVQPK